MKLAITFFALLILTLAASNAEASKDRGGGDLCEKRILEVADDLSGWIKAGGSAGLNLPVGITLDKYNSNMLAAIDTTKVRCVKPGDQGYPVHVGSAAKACRFDRTPADQYITCDYEVFMNKEVTSENDQYILVHHEYAGIAGVENPNDEVSTYTLSSQITRFLDFVTVKKLAVKPKPVNNARADQDAAADARILASCEAYKNKVNNKISTFISSKGGTLSHSLEIGTCAPYTYYGENKPAMVLTLPAQFTVVVMGDDGQQATLDLHALQGSAYPVNKLEFAFRWHKTPVYDNLGKIDGYNYTFGYDDQSPNDTAYGPIYDYYYSVKNSETGQFLGGVRINN